MLKRLCSPLPLFVLLAAGTVQAQTNPEPPRIEVGAHFTALHLPAIHEWPGGFGARLGYNLCEYVAVEGEFNYFPVHRPKTSGSSPLFQFERPPGSFGESQALFGIKAGLRVDRFGLFGEIKPGFIRLTERQQLESLNDQSKMRFALRVGGVFEYYLSPSVAFRLDMGKTRVDFGGYKPIGDYPAQDSPDWGFHTSLGLVFRF